VQTGEKTGKLKGEIGDFCYTALIMFKRRRFNSLNENADSTAKKKF
jgi:hypothetical protein